MSAAESAIPEGFKRYRFDDGFEGHIGPLFYRLEGENKAVFGLRTDRRHANVRGVIHGGLMMSLADHVLGAAVFFGAGRKPCATISLNCDFLAPGAVGDWIEGRAEITRATRSYVFVGGKLTVGDRLLMTASGIWKILKAK